MTDDERADFDRFDEEADLILKKTNPDMYERYMKVEAEREQIQRNGQ